MPRPKNIDDYLAGVSGVRRATLERLRRTIAAALPGAEECISYSMPAFRYRGKVVAGFLATGGGCSYYPFSGSTLTALGAELEGYERTKSALHFAPERGLPARIVRLLLKARLAELPAETPRRPAARKVSPKQGQSRAPRAKARVRTG